jgi:hypothetical protein
MPAPDLTDLLTRYAKLGLEEWSRAPGELQRRAGICLLNQIVENDYQLSKTINTDYTAADADALRFIPMPPVGMKGMERCFFLPIKKRSDGGSLEVSFDLFVLVDHQNCLAFRFEPADVPGHSHSYTHAQLCTRLRRKTLLLNVLPTWIPDTYPAFPVSASTPIELFLAMATSVHGNHQGGLRMLLQDIFVGLPNDAKHYADGLRNMLCN